MNEETMRKHYEATPKDRLINILISARLEFNKLQNRNKECKQEIERLNNKLLLIKGIIRTPRELDKSLAYAMVKTQIEYVLGSDKE